MKEQWTTRYHRLLQANLKIVVSTRYASPTELGIKAVYPHQIRMESPVARPSHALCIAVMEHDDSNVEGYSGL